MKNIFFALFLFVSFNCFAQEEVLFTGNTGSGWSVSTKYPKWIKVTKSYTDFATAGLTNDILVYTLPAKGIVHGVQMVVSPTFSGGLIATYTISVGIAGTLNKYATATNVFTGATLPAISTTMGIESTSGTTAIRAQAISTIGNLNAATQGSVDIYILTSTLP